MRIKYRTFLRTGGILLLLAGGFLAVRIHHGYQKDILAYDSLRDTYIEIPHDSGERQKSEIKLISKELTESPGMSESVRMPETEEVSERITGTETCIDWDGLFQINQDLVAWIDIPELDLSYPVVQSEQDEDYLHKSFAGEDSYSGTLFLDHTCNPDFSDPVSVIYGHNMRNGSMFGTLKDWENRGFESSEGRTVRIFLPDRTILYRVTDFCRVRIQDVKELRDAEFLPKETEEYPDAVCPSPDNAGEALPKPRLLLVTCTSDSSYRLVVVCRIDGILSV